MTRWFAAITLACLAASTAAFCSPRSSIKPNSPIESTTSLIVFNKLLSWLPSTPAVEDDLGSIQNGLVYNDLPPTTDPYEPPAESTFDFTQRIESLKAAAIAGIAGSIAYCIPAAVHYFVIGDMVTPQVPLNALAQWEFSTDMAVLQGAVFGLVYRYAVRGDKNAQLSQGVLAAFGLTRTLGSLHVPTYCTSVPLQCGAPLGYLDWSLLGQIVVGGLESIALFGGALWAVEEAFKRGWVQKFE
jgi:hypothetical protein